MIDKLQSKINETYGILGSADFEYDDVKYRDAFNLDGQVQDVPTVIANIYNQGIQLDEMLLGNTGPTDPNRTVIDIDANFGGQLIDTYKTLYPETDPLWRQPSLSENLSFFPIQWQGDTAYQVV